MSGPAAPLPRISPPCLLNPFRKTAYHFWSRHARSANMTSIILEGQAYYYPSRMKDFTIDDNDLTRTCPLDNHKHHIDPKHDLGALDTLPLELLGLVLLQTDLCSLIDFRLINNRAMQVVDSLIEHKSIQRHAPDLLRGILSVEMGPHISIQPSSQRSRDSNAKIAVTSRASSTSSLAGVSAFTVLPRSPCIFR
jgi:hypothetical protein